ncbi:GDSL esterase/lipase At5g45960-like [Bidens hawaiensis]|uniref:GDSL esterase/lipase At5g45960-like n=1 Tax=Bidens hawaiensis TaxID=980011 RepID=UPI00404A0272
MVWLSTKMDYSLALYHIIYLLYVLLTCTKSQARTKPSAVFVFGDSTVDAGNNNFIQTPMKSNFPPYGRDFINHIPTGRFTNGRLVSDFIASYTGVKDTVPAYLDPTLTIQDLMTGVTFASAGSGFDPLTAMLSSAISMEKQMEYFKEYKSKIEMWIGKESTVELINKATFMISAGTNDFVVNYYGLGEPVTQVIYPNVTSYRNFLLQNIHQFVQGLMNEGARRIAMVGLPPMGCLPGVITMNRYAATHGRICVESMSSVATDYNVYLENKLKEMPTSEAKFYYADIYNPIIDMMQSGLTKNLGFEEVSVGCCGSGYIEAAELCNMNSAICDDASKYLFWDSIHPTEHAYYYIFTTIRPVVDKVLNDYVQGPHHLIKG